MSALRRLAVGSFREFESLALDSLSFEAIERQLLPPVMALGDMPRITLETHELARLARGQSIANRWSENGVELAALDANRRLAAIVVPAGEQLQPAKCFILAQRLL